MKAVFYGIKKVNKFRGRMMWFSDNEGGTEGTTGGTEGTTGADTSTTEGKTTQTGDTGGTKTNPLEDPAVKELIEKVRKEEKDKLYKTISEKEAKIKELDAAQKAKEEAVAIAEAAKKITEEQMTTELAKLTVALSKVQEDQKRSQLELYKEKALKSAGTDLIEALVGGNTEEEIDLSIERAKTEYMNIIEKVKTQTKTTEPFTKTTNPAQPKTTKQLAVGSILNMSDADYAKSREDLAKQLGA